MSTNKKNPNGEEPLSGKNPPLLTKEVHRSSEGVSVQEHDAQLNFNFARLLGTDALRRYSRYYKIKGINSDSSREEMLNAVQQHFASRPPLDERQVIPKFIKAARRLKTKDKKSKD